MKYSGKNSLRNGEGVPLLGSWVLLLNFEGGPSFRVLESRRLGSRVQVPTFTPCNLTEYTNLFLPSKFEKNDDIILRHFMNNF